MSAIPPKDAEQSQYEPLFSYGQLRGHYLNSDMSKGLLHIGQFARPEHLALLRSSLSTDSNALTPSPDAASLLSLSPVSRQCLWELHSGIMLRVLENITGLFNLLPDTYCKQSRLLLAGEKSGLGEWRDRSTGLSAVLVVVLQLDSGSADLCTSAEVLPLVKTESAALQITYWQHHPDNAGATS